MKFIARSALFSALLVIAGFLTEVDSSKSQLRQSAYQCSLNGGRSPWYYVTWYDGWNKFNFGTSQGRDGLMFKKQGDFVKDSSGRAYSLSLWKGKNFVLSSLDGTEIYECDF